MALCYKEELQEAINYYQCGHFQEASFSFEKLIKNYSNKPESYYYLAKIESEFYKNIKKAIELMSKAVDITPFYEAYKELTQYSIAEKDLPSVLKHAKQTLTYNSQCEQTLSVLKNLFPKEIHFIRDKETVINRDHAV